MDEKDILVEGNINDYDESKIYFIYESDNISKIGYINRDMPAEYRIKDGNFKSFPSVYRSKYQKLYEGDSDAKHEFILHIGGDDVSVNENIVVYIKNYRSIYRDNRIYLINSPNHINLGNIVENMTFVQNLSEVDDKITDALIVIDNVDNLKGDNRRKLEDFFCIGGPLRIRLLLRCKSIDERNKSIGECFHEATTFCVYNQNNDFFQKTLTKISRNHGFKINKKLITNDTKFVCIDKCPYRNKVYYADKFIVVTGK